ncbi:hypothetical protein B0H14DRAFT_3430918 [Mycena olivaceomarginata]|nr:hypothetical protein B0H14DRAFT_3430918 [Mycena olivaceomarginata]
MAIPDYSEAQFNANLPPLPLGRGLRESQLTPGRQLHDQQLEKNAEAGRKRAATMAYNATSGTTGSRAAPGSQNQCAVRRPPVAQHTFSTPQPLPSLNAYQTPHRPLPPPQPLREPLQPLEANSSPNYMDFSRRESSRAIPLPPAFVRGPPLSNIEWFTGLSESDKAALLNSFSAGSTSSGADQWGSMQNLSRFESGDRDFHDDSIGLEMDGSRAPGPHEIPGMEERNDEPWTQLPDDGPADIDESPPVSSLQFTVRTVQPDYQKKRKQHTDTIDLDDTSDDEESAGPKKRKQKSRSIASIAADHAEICELAFDHLRKELTHRTPFPVAAGRRRATVPRAAPAVPVPNPAVSGAAGTHRSAVAQTDEFTELVLSAFTEAAFDSEMGNTRPTAEDMRLIRSRVPTFRGGLKVVARRLVPDAYGFIAIETLENPTPALISATLEKNRARVEKITKTYIYTDPDNITPESMFLHGIFQRVYTGYWFGTNENDRAVYFKDKTRIELVTLAFIIVAVLCAIQEWSTGRWKNRKFSHSAYFMTYKATLNGLKRWLKHSEDQVQDNRAASNATIDLQERMLRVARAASFNPEEELPEEDDGDLFSLNAMFSMASGDA